MPNERDQWRAQLAQQALQTATAPTRQIIPIPVQPTREEEHDQPLAARRCHLHPAGRVTLACIAGIKDANRRSSALDIAALLADQQDAA